jgi:hypothetical protein
MHGETVNFSVGAELLQADGDLDMTELVAFRNFAKTPK